MNHFYTAFYRGDVYQVDLGKRVGSVESGVRPAVILQNNKGNRFSRTLIIVPLMVPEDKLLWTFCAFCASLTALLGIVCVHTRGTWFWIASSAVLFGLSVIFLPFVIRAKPVKKLIGDANKWLVVLGIDGALFVNMMNMIRFDGHINLSTILFTVAVIAGIAMVVLEIIRKKGTSK